MVELLKEITFDITKSLEVDLSTKKKQKRRKRVDDYDYTDNFIEPFEGEEDLVEIECSISNFFVYQGILPGSIKKVINQYKNKKPVTPPKMMSESRILEDALIMRRKRKASSNVLSDPFIKENEGLEEIYNKLSSKKIKSKKQNIDKKLEDVKSENAIENYDNLPVFNDEVIYKEVVNNYLYKKFKKLKDNYENLNVNDKIVYFVINYMFFEYNPELYEENEKICKKITVDIEEGEILDPNSDFVKYKNINEKNYDINLYAKIKQFFTDFELDEFSRNLIKKIDEVFMKISIFLNDRTNYSSDKKKFNNVRNNEFKENCVSYCINYIMKHYTVNTKKTVVEYINEAKRNIEDLFYPVEKRIRILYLVNNRIRDMIEKNNFKY